MSGICVGEDADEVGLMIGTDIADIVAVSSVADIDLRRNILLKLDFAS